MQWDFFWKHISMPEAEGENAGFGGICRLIGAVSSSKGKKEVKSA